ncbi:MAG TPA: hypothetical protein VFQ13_13665 [Anaerolineales bacterium]|nr:hypothetical protein [Anaerolineales bacterium]
MTQRSIFAGKNETILIKVGGSVIVKGHESDRLVAAGTGGLTVDRRSASEIGRARAAVGDHVFFDVRIKLPGKQSSNEMIEVQIGDSGEVLVPFESDIKVYAGKDIDVQGLKGQVDAFAGLNLKVMDVYSLGNISAGGSMDVDARAMTGKDVTFGAGRDLRFHVADLTSLRLRVKDIGGYWEAHIGGGEKSVYLKSGGDVTFVTDQQVEPLPPNYVLGKIERPA